MSVWEDQLAVRVTKSEDEFMLGWVNCGGELNVIMSKFEDEQMWGQVVSVERNKSWGRVMKGCVICENE